MNLYAPNIQNHWNVNSACTPWLKQNTLKFQYQSCIHYKIHRQTKIISSFSSTSSWFSASLGLSALQLQEKWFSIAMIQKLSSFRAIPEKIIWKRFVCVPVCCFCSAWKFFNSYGDIMTRELKGCKLWPISSIHDHLKYNDPPF